MFIKRKAVNSIRWLLGMLVVLALLRVLDHWKIIPLENISTRIFTGLLQYPVFSALPVMLAVITFRLNNAYLRDHLYLEELKKDEELKKEKSYSFMNRFGELGDIMALDLKLILRNKRPRSLLILSAVFLLYGFFFYPQYLESNSYGTLFLFALLITGIFMANYGQFLFAWQSGHFDGIMTSHLNMRQFIRAKFALLLLVCSMQFLVASFYGFMSWRIIPIQLAAYLYTIGVNSFVTIYAATYHYKHLDLGKSASMNFQGMGALQILQSLAISFGPAVVFFLLNRFAGFWPAVLSVGGLGMTGLIFHRQIIDWLAGQFLARKYRILEGFRER